MVCQITHGQWRGEDAEWWSSMSKPCRVLAFADDCQPSATLLALLALLDFLDLQDAYWASICPDTHCQRIWSACALRLRRISPRECFVDVYPPQYLKTSERGFTCSALSCIDASDIPYLRWRDDGPRLSVVTLGRQSLVLVFLPPTRMAPTVSVLCASSKRCWSPKPAIL